ncbi:unnamed protein product [Coregonus sp. 'balchen']|nr:unnamed protein product [Coregonus sp. 'balchen']
MEEAGERQAALHLFPPDSRTRSRENRTRMRGHPEDKGVSEWRGWRLLTIAGLFDCWTPPSVSSLVNNSRNNSPECLLPVDPQVKKAPKPSAGSKMKMGWLKSSTPSKRKALDTGEVEQEGHTGETRPEKQPKTAGSQ